jgi:hypothetical protein
MRTRASILVAAAALVLAGCGDHNLVLRVDVLSYVDPAMRSATFGPIPPTPGGLATGEQALVDDETINLVDGMSGVAEVEAVEITLAVTAHDSTGSGVDTLRLYASDEETAPLATAPVLQQVVELRPGETNTVSVTVAGDRRVAELFVKRLMRISVTSSGRGPESGDPLNGSVELSTLEAVVIAGRKAP